MRNIFIYFTSICLAIFALFTAFNVSFNISSASAGEMETVELKKGDFGLLPEVEFVDKDGKKHKLNSKDHKITILHFWATWCVPCIDELPQIDDTAGIYGKKLQIIPIALDGNNLEKVKKFFKNHKIKNLPILLDPTAKTSKTAGLKGLPGSLFINNKGEVVAIAQGPIDWQSKQFNDFIKKYVTSD